MKNRTAFPPKTLHRLILYQNVLEPLWRQNVSVITSHELSKRCGNTSAQVRRDLMSIAPGGKSRCGYGVAALYLAINNHLKSSPVLRVAMVGVGRLGSALAENLSRHRAGYRLTWVFDRDSAKIGKRFGGCLCMHVERLPGALKRRPVDLGILAVDPEQAQDLVDILVAAGARGIVNLTSVPVRVPDDVFLEQFNLNLLFKKFAFFLKGIR